jgi:hypothetical protein
VRGHVDPGGREPGGEVHEQDPVWINREVHEQDPCGSTVRFRPHECDARHARHALLAVYRRLGTP